MSYLPKFEIEFCGFNFIGHVSWHQFSSFWNKFVDNGFPNTICCDVFEFIRIWFYYWVICQTRKLVLNETTSSLEMNVEFL